MSPAAILARRPKAGTPSRIPRDVRGCPGPRPFPDGLGGTNVQAARRHVEVLRQANPSCCHSVSIWRDSDRLDRATSRPPFGGPPVTARLERAVVGARRGEARSCHPFPLLCHLTRICLCGRVRTGRPSLGGNMRRPYGETDFCRGPASRAVRPGSPSWFTGADACDIPRPVEGGDAPPSLLT
jgi:hypothetical protein